MKVKFSAITGEEKQLKAVESDWDALRYILDIDMFKKIALHFNIEVEF